MRTLLIANYWTPYNNAGTLRWWNFAKFVDFDVLTVKNTKGIIDESLEERGNNIERIRNVGRIASLNGLLLSIVACFKKADLYIFTSPPETLLVGAYILQKMGKKVVIDLRDQMDREHQQVKILLPLYKFLYKNIKNVIVTWKMIDPTKVVIHHGHDSLTLKSTEKKTMPEGRFTHKEYNEMLEKGFIPNYNTHGNWVKGYVTSSYVNIKHLWKERSELVHEELEETFYPWEHQAQLLENFLQDIMKGK